VVIGGGNVAERKVARLLECGARVEVVSRELTPALAALSASGKIVHRDGLYEDSHLSGASLVIGATDDGAVNGRIAAAARRLGIPVNIVDDPPRCDFILPSVVERGDLQISVSTGGKSPALARKLREELEGHYGPEYAILLGILGDLRQKLLADPSQGDHQERFTALVRSDILDSIRREAWEEVRATIFSLTGIDMEVKGR
jgi:precorrin-2 dehydrogenase/sirohydrochlorin ferrochelatase